MSTIICFMSLACCRKLLQSTKNIYTKQRQQQKLETQIKNLNSQIIENFHWFELEQSKKRTNIYVSFL